MNHRDPLIVVTKRAEQLVETDQVQHSARLVFMRTLSCPLSLRSGRVVYGRSTFVCLACLAEWLRDIESRARCRRDYILGCRLRSSWLNGPLVYLNQLVDFRMCNSRIIFNYYNMLIYNRDEGLYRKLVE